MGAQYRDLLTREYALNVIGTEFIVMITMLISVLIVMNRLSLSVEIQIANTVEKDLKDP